MSHWCSALRTQVVTAWFHLSDVDITGANRKHSHLVVTVWQTTPGEYPGYDMTRGAIPTTNTTLVINLITANDTVTANSLQAKEEIIHLMHCIGVLFGFSHIKTTC